MSDVPLQGGIQARGCSAPPRVGDFIEGESMARGFTPTSAAQVSGHKFLERRVEHALVTGDTRMISDPLELRSRASIFGVVMLLLLCAGAGLMAFIKPAIDPGQAAIVKSDSGALFVRMGGQVHPVTNLASARLITGKNDEPARISDSVLLKTPIGAKVGLPEAPELIARSLPEKIWWVVCHSSSDGQIAVQILDQPLSALQASQGVLMQVGGKEYVVTQEGRRQLPDPLSAEGRVMRRRLDIDASTPRWAPPPEVARLIPELPVSQIPREGSVLRAGTDSWWARPEGIQPLSAVQADMMADMGMTLSSVSREDIAQRQDAAPRAVELPEIIPQWVAPEVMCVDGASGQVSTKGQMAGLEISGDSVATRFRGLQLGSVVVDSGTGTRVISESGTVFPLPDDAARAALGLPEKTYFVSWDVLRLLPQGSELTAQAARVPVES